MIYIANWKQNFERDEVIRWFENWAEIVPRNLKEGWSRQDQIVICPPIVFLDLAFSLKNSLELDLSFGVQNISPFPDGAFTGEVGVSQVDSVADFVIIGHSERRNLLGETESLVLQKTELVLSAGLVPVVCVSSLSQAESLGNLADQNELFLAYEPLSAIGSGHPAHPDQVQETAEKLKEIVACRGIIYGGSISGENVRQYLDLPDIDGFLVGGASLNPLAFWEIICS